MDFLKATSSYINLENGKTISEEELHTLFEFSAHLQELLEKSTSPLSVKEKKLLKDKIAKRPKKN